MISEYVLKKSEGHKVSYIRATPRFFYSDVESSSGENYSVILSINCTCKSKSFYHTNKENLCSHEVAVLRELLRRN